MLQSCKIINFRSIQNLNLNFDDKINNIVWKNWAWKTNVLQAISYLFGENTFNLKNENIVSFWENNLFIEWIFIDKIWIEQKLSLSYSKSENKKLILLNWKKVTKKNLDEVSLKVCSFYPITMNLFYLWPKYRRDFLDDILKNCFLEYKDLLKNYETILKSRNKILKNINIWESQVWEIKFWDEKFIFLAEKIYKYRNLIIDDFSKKIWENNIFLKWENNIELKYLTKTNLEDISWSIKQYLDKNLSRDIILWKTQIWPHVDDFDILINDISLVDYASRGETKSIIMTLKKFEIEFIKKHTWKNPILLIDDLSSELDDEHVKLFMEENNNFQSFFTSILPINNQNLNTITI